MIPRLSKQVISCYNTRYWLESKHMWSSNRLPSLEKFITFTPWHGGFNNIRMSFEMALALSYALNRTLILPPSFKLYLRGTSDLTDYFDFKDISKGFSVKKYNEFLEENAKFENKQEKYEISGEKMHSSVDRYYEGLKDYNEGEVLFIDKALIGEKTIVGDIMFCVPKCPQRGKKKKGKEEYWFQNFARRKQVLFSPMDETVKKAEIIHFPHNLLGQFYTMICFYDKRRQQEMNRLIKDHLRFKEEIFSLAERIVNSKAVGGVNNFSCIHVRRNEFQFEHVKIDAEKITSNIEGLIQRNEVLYIATDEIDSKNENGKSVSMDPLVMTRKRKHTWFQPLKDRYGEEKTFFLDDFYDKYLNDAPKVWLSYCFHLYLDWLY
eukprot:snap_masked-scaffold_14-processed-gene-2.19-mRNA-1 protein AED:0.33 eAED:0.35 QI:0/-1/0/1/-1/1/1/0/377